MMSRRFEGQIYKVAGEKQEFSMLIFNFSHDNDYPDNKNTFPRSILL